MAVVVPTQDATELTAQELTEHLAPSFAKFWLPDDFVFVKEIPKTSVGKFDKKVLRQQYAQGYLS
jgi:fatty-acyl-CoA synthase